MHHKLPLRIFIVTVILALNPSFFSVNAATPVMVSERLSLDNPVIPTLLLKMDLSNLPLSSCVGKSIRCKFDEHLVVK
jgi:hypothetical protein